MPANLISQIVRQVSSKLNLANDASPGISVASGTGAAQYQGILGSRVALGPDEIRFDSTTGTLFGGVYQYVRFATGATAAPARGLVAFWDTSVAENLYQVTNDENVGSSCIAGATLNAVTKNNFGWIQVAGKATFKTRATLTAAGAAGQTCQASYAGAGADVATVDNESALAGVATVAQVQAGITAGLRAFIGKFEGTPANATQQTVEMTPWFMRI